MAQVMGSLAQRKPCITFIDRISNARLSQTRQFTNCAPDRALGARHNPVAVHRPNDSERRANCPAKLQKITIRRGCACSLAIESQNLEFAKPLAHHWGSLAAR